MKNGVRILIALISVLVVVLIVIFSLVNQAKESGSIIELNTEIETLVSKNLSLEKTDAQIVNLLEQRKGLLLEQLKANPRDIYSTSSLASNTLEKLRLAGYKNIEKSVSNLSGNLEMIHYDDFENSENSFFEYYLTTRDGVKFRIYPFDQEHLDANKKIEIRQGIQLDKNIFGETRMMSVNIEATPDIIATNTSTTIRWNAAEANSCTGTGGSPGWAGPKNITGGTFTTGKLTSNATYTINCQNSFDTVTSSATVTVVSNPTSYIQNDLVSYIPPITEPTPYKIAVFLVNPNPNWPIPFSVEDVKKEVFDGQFQKFIKEASYGKRYVAGDVYGWIQLNQSSPKCSPTMDNTSINFKTPGIEEYIANNNISLEAYNHILFVSHCTTNNGKSSVGTIIQTVNGKIYNFSVSTINIKGDGLTEQWIGQPLGVPQPFSWTRFDRLLSHELGHAFGLVHANGIDCDNESIDPTCSHVEYGNAFDSMGEHGYALHYNGLYKKILGWLGQKQSINITQSGRYTINPLETNQGIKNATISNPTIPSSTKYNVEYRQAIGFDGILNNPILSKNQNGLLINKEYLPINLLIDAKPSNAEWFLDIQNAALEATPGGNIPSFIDSESGITIGKVKKGINNISFDVQIDTNIPHCIHYPTDVSVTFSPFTFSLNNPSYQNIQLTNIDDANLCGGSKLGINIIPVDDIIQEHVVIMDLPAGSTKFLSIGTDQSAQLKINPETIPGTYTYDVNVINISYQDTPQVHKSITINVVP